MSTLTDQPSKTEQPNTEATPMFDDGRTYCAVHTNVETGLKCNKCGRYMCVKCAVRTPVGYRCKQCVHQQQDVYFTATTTDYLIAAAVSTVLSIPIAFVLMQLGLFLIIILGLPAGGLISEVVLRATGKRRGRYTWAVVGGGILAGAVIAMLVNPAYRIFFLSLLQSSGRRGADATGLGLVLITPVLYVVLCAGAAVARLRYGK